MIRVIIAGWFAAGGLLALGGSVGVAIHRRTCDPTMTRLARRLLEAEANQDHTRCQATVDAMAAYIAHQERQLDLRAADPAQVVGEAERIAREAGS